MEIQKRETHCSCKSLEPRATCPMDGKQQFSDLSSNHNPSSKNPSFNGQRWGHYQVFKNLVCISFSILLLFTSFKGLSYLQSTINSQQGIGVISEAVGFAIFSLSGLFAPKIVIRKLGCKLALTLTMLAYSTAFIANLYPKWEIFIPCAILLGISASILWPSAYTYLNKLSELYHDGDDLKGTASSAALFFGIFGACLLLSETTGNLISYFVLKKQKSSSLNITEYRCGIQFEERNTLKANNANLQDVDKDLRNTLIGIYLCLSILSVLPIVFILDSLPNNNNNTEAEEHSLAKRLTATFRIMIRKQQILLMPLALYLGMQGAFYMADFTRAYIACSWDIYHIGLVSTCYGVSAGVCSTFSGRLRKYISRIPLCATAAVLNIVAFIQLFLWTPDPEKPVMFYIFAVMWGSFNGIYVAQIRALYGHLFRGEEESAFANYYIWEALGYALSYGYSSYFFIVTKLCLLITVFCFAQVGYLVLEWDIHNSTREEKVQILQNSFGKNQHK